MLAYACSCKQHKQFSCKFFDIFEFLWMKRFIKLSQWFLFKTTLQSIASLEIYCSICYSSATVSTSHENREFSKSSSCSMTLRSAILLANSSLRPSMCPLYLFADVALTDRHFRRGKCAKFLLDICFAKNVSFH